MSESDQFVEYAQEATISASGAKTQKEKIALLDLASVWRRTAKQAQKFLLDTE